MNFFQRIIYRFMNWSVYGPALDHEIERDGKRLAETLNSSVCDDIRRIFINYDGHVHKLSCAPREITSPEGVKVIQQISPFSPDQLALWVGIEEVIAGNHSGAGWWAVCCEANAILREQHPDEIIAKVN